MTGAVGSSAQGKRMTPTEYKNLEGQRIQAIMGAIAALPGAALVASKPEGAPLFAAALIAVAVAFLFWILTDAIYHFSTIPHQTPAEWARLMRAGYRYQWSTIGYAALSIVLTLAGFAGAHSDLRSPVTIEAGFGLAVVFFVAALLHALWSVDERNKINVASRAVSLRNLAAGQQQQTPPQP